MTVDPEPDVAPSTLLALSDRFSDRTRRLLGAYMVGHTVWRIGKKYWDRAKAERTYTVAVSGSDPIYPEVHRWLLDSLPTERQRAVTAQSTRGDREIASPEGASSPPPELVLFYDGTRVQTVDIEGHRITVSLDRPEWSRDDRSDEDRRWTRRYERIIFTASSLAGRDAVRDFLTEIVRAQSKRLPRLVSVTRWSDWTHSSDVPPRPLPTVVLRSGQVERIVADVADFLSRESDYARLGIPYHRGYLLHGPPGTGKTSIAKAIAGHLGLDVYYLPLTALKDDAVLNSLIGAVSARSVLLLEDVDIVAGARDATDGEHVTLQGLLNALDGLATPHGLILVMTTNHVDVLDRRLIRPGRVDVTEEIGHLDDDQLSRLVEVFLGPVDLPGLGNVRLVPADVVDVLKRHLGDKKTAVDELRSLIEGDQGRTL
jgi:hypothetical protein